MWMQVRTWWRDAREVVVVDRGGLEKCVEVEVKVDMGGVRCQEAEGGEWKDGEVCGDWLRWRRIGGSMVKCA